MSCFLLPQNVLNKLKGAISKFWWSTKNNNRGLHWLAWDKICIPQSLGGLGFRDLKEFNLALFAKQLWRLLRFSESLLCRVLKGRYFQYSNPMESTSTNSLSYAWRSIIAAKPLLQQGLRRNIRSGFNTKVWSDNWIPTVPARPAKDNGVRRDPFFYVNHLIDFETKEWKVDRIQEMVDPDDVPLILGFRPSRTFQVDDYVWTLTKSRHYMVKSGYILATQGALNLEEVLEPSTTTLRSQVWKTKASKRLKHFMWQALAGCVASCGRLTDRHCGTDRSCPRCGHEEESINHVMFECPPAFQVWAFSQIPTIPGVFPCSSLFSNFDFLFWHAKENGGLEEHIDSIPWLLWYIWKARNEKTFNGMDIFPLDTLKLALSEATSWKLAQIMENTTEEEEVRSQTQSDEEEDRDVIRCQVDASWTAADHFSGLGFVIEGQAQMLYGAHYIRRCLSCLLTAFVLNSA